MSIAAATQGAILASFCASVGILLGRHDYQLSGAQYSVVFLAQVVAAVTAALIAATSAKRFSRGRALRLGLGLDVFGLLLLIAALAPGSRSVAQLQLLLVASCVAGGGFGFVYPALTAFALDAVPHHAERSVLELNLMLAVGLAVSPGLEVAAANAGAWWTLEAVLCVLGLLVIAAASRSRLGPDASRSCKLNLLTQQRSGWYKVYPALAVLAGACAIMLAGWAQSHRHGQALPHPAFSVLLLASFWAATVTTARVAFAVIDRRRTLQRSASLVPFLLAAGVMIAGLATGQHQTVSVGVLLLAAFVCAAFLPLPASASPDADRLMLVSLACTAGFIGLYPADLGIAEPAIGHLENSGAPAVAIFLVTGVVGVVASLVAAGVPGSQRSVRVGSGPGPQLRSGSPVPVSAHVSNRASEGTPIGQAAESERGPGRYDPPYHSCTASDAGGSNRHC